MWKYLIYILPCTLIAQENHDWWHVKHNIGTLPHWSNVIEISSALMGPNALPVPDIGKAHIDRGNVSIGYANHFGFGDHTQNLTFSYLHAFEGKKVAIRVWGVPFEAFEMDTVTRDLRKSRERDGKGQGFGDLYVGTIVQLLRESKQGINMQGGFSVKTASGGNLGAARFTNAPGYSFDIKFGKTLFMNNSNTVQVNAMSGLFVYQTNRTEYFQNDAFLYGLSLNIQHKGFSFTPSIRGYYGYINNGDRPQLLKLEMQQRMKQNSIKVALQEGLNDFPYRSIFLSFERTLN
ncbi:MAG: hypothetical protein MRY83_12600 [Flavobacteriales bacterium]|nr:hypothetical protein [Flavobacteriales bacterium]